LLFCDFSALERGFSTCLSNDDGSWGEMHETRLGSTFRLIFAKRKPKFTRIIEISSRVDCGKSPRVNSKSSDGAMAMKFLPGLSTNDRRMAFFPAATILALMLAVLAPAGALAQAVITPVGSGTQADPYQIAVLGNLVWLQAMAASDLTSGTQYLMTSDIDASETAYWNDTGTGIATLEGFYPIGDSSTPFRGKFMGAGHKITGLVVNRSSMSYVGLFGYVATNGSVYNLGLEGGSVTGLSYVGDVAGYNAGAIAQCHATGAASETATRSAGYAGGLAGWNTGAITQCHATGAASGAGSEIGGLVGYNAGAISDCYATGAVSQAGQWDAGGLTGWNVGGTITRCHATGNVTGISWVGGLTPYSDGGTITQCYATGAVKGTGGEVGGLMGGVGTSGTISNCYATGAAKGTDSSVGGLVGILSSGTISNCYAIGVASAGSFYGGLVGSKSGTVTASFWNKETSGLASSAGGTGKTTLQMKTEDTFTTGGATWDFASIWAIRGGYPYLQDLTTCTLTYKPGANGKVGDGLTTTTTTTDAVTQVINLAATGTPVKAQGTTAHYRFSRWDDSLTSNPRTDAGVTTDTTRTAQFNDYYTLTYVAGTGGSLATASTGPGQHSITRSVVYGDWGTTVTAIAAAGYEFTGWSDGVSNATRADVATADLTVTANFTPSSSGITPANAAETDAGTSGNPYEIRTLGNLAWMHNQAATTVTATLGKYYKLMNDINASGTSSWNSGAGFNPIGATDALPFKGVFLGQGHAITGLVINRPSTSYVGLFGYVFTGGVVDNLGLEGGSVTGGSYVGDLAGINAGAITNCHATGDVTGISYIGGLAGFNANMISNCHATGSVAETGTGSSGNAGGLAGYNAGTITQCYATGAASGAGSDVGGLVGYNNYGTISDCYATGAASQAGSYMAGGLVGWNVGGTITRCHATGNVTGTRGVAGLVAYTTNNGTITQCYATGNVTGTGDFTAGLVSELDAGTISNCYVTGATKGTGGYVGGLVGLLYLSSGTISNCYATGATTAGSYYGGLVGYVFSGTVTGSFWNAQTSGLASSAGGTGLTTLQMKVADNFTSGSTTWDFASTWAIHGGYPYLQSLTTCTLAYKADMHGRVADGLTTTTTTTDAVTQVVNLAASGTPIRAIANEGYRFVRWDDSLTNNPRTDAGLTTDTTWTALFDRKNAAKYWLEYR
jgi:hypothetical protein